MNIAGGNGVCWGVAGDIVDSVVIDRNEEADQGQWQGIPVYRSVFANKGDGKNGHQRIEADPLIPAENARCVTHDIAKIKAGEHPGKGKN